MLDKMGLKVNRDEAEMLVLCIDTDGNERVTMNEFLDLVFTQNDGISKLDLNKMGVGNEQLGSGEERKQSFVEELKKKAELAAKLRPLNQWRLFLQKNLNNIAMDLLTVDSDRKYYVEYKDLMKVIDRRAKIPEYLKNENGELLHELLGQYTDHNNGHVDYRGLVEDIRDFNYEQANQKGTSGRDLQESRVAAFSRTPGNETRKRKTIFEDEYIVLDSQKVPPNVLDVIDKRLHRVTRHLKRVFGNQSKLDAAIKETVGE
jgi:Ca2+-binding EF-hand superfamily protein